MVRNKARKARGLTLIELVVVIAILGALAAMLLPKFDGLMSAANHVTCAASSSDLARLLQVYKVSKTVFPDGWDSLTDGTTMWTGTATASSPAGADILNGGNAGTFVKGVHPQICNPTSGKCKLSTTPLSADQVAAFKTVGINTLYNVATGSSLRPGDMFITPAAITTTTPFVVLNTGTSGGRKIIDHVYRQNLRTGGTSGALPADTQLVVFGCGPQNSLVPNSMLESPTYANTNASFVYNRLLVVFELTLTRVTFKAVLGSDGDILDDLSVNLQTQGSL